jgi:hypothetical protein
MRRPRPPRGYSAFGKKNSNFINSAKTLFLPSCERPNFTGSRKNKYYFNLLVATTFLWEREGNCVIMIECNRTEHRRAGTTVTCALPHLSIICATL